MGKKNDRINALEKRCYALETVLQNIAMLLKTAVGQEKTVIERTFLSILEGFVEGLRENDVLEAFPTSAWFHNAKNGKIGIADIGHVCYYENEKTVTLFVTDQPVGKVLNYDASSNQVLVSLETLYTKPETYRRTAPPNCCWFKNSLSDPLTLVDVQKDAWFEHSYVVCKNKHEEISHKVGRVLNLDTVTNEVLVLLY